MPDAWYGDVWCMIQWYLVHDTVVMSGVWYSDNWCMIQWGLMYGTVTSGAGYGDVCCMIQWFLAHDTVMSDVRWSALPKASFTRELSNVNEVMVAAWSTRNRFAPSECHPSRTREVSLGQDRIGSKPRCSESSTWRNSNAWCMIHCCSVWYSDALWMVRWCWVYHTVMPTVWYSYIRCMIQLYYAWCSVS